MFKTILRTALLLSVIAAPVLAQAELTETRTIQPAPQMHRHHHCHHHMSKHHRHHHHHHKMAMHDKMAMPDKMAMSDAPK